MRRCEASVVYVDRIYLTCDSPGDYYYGSGGYRKSSRCKYGDKANMYIFFTISQDYGWYGIDVTIDAGVLDSFVNVQPRTDLCSLETMTYLPSTSDITDGMSNSIYCPTPGNYQLYWSFTVPKGGGDAQLQYTPDFRLKFYSTTTSTTLGCAGTGTKATVQQAELHKKEGEIALGVALATLFGILLSAFAWHTDERNSLNPWTMICGNGKGCTWHEVL
ncbi:hypothetical protein MHU86_16288 [Fragilaria crotonensis]|nr:hypothetical protein MHU86_16288 [Fragilaria crotonensis]